MPAPISSLYRGWYFDPDSRTLNVYFGDGAASDPARILRINSTSFGIRQDGSILDGFGMVIGGTSQITLNALIPEFQVQGTTVGVDAAMAAILYSATAGEGAELILGRSKSATLGTNTIVASGDLLGRILAVGADGGSGFDPAASIGFYSDGTPGAATDMPGRIVFFTSPDGSQTQTEVFRVDSAQNIIVADGNGIILGDAARVTTNALAEFQMLGTAAADSEVLAGQWSAAATGPSFALIKSRNATIGSSTIVQNADVLGSLVAYADDGTDFATPAASITFLVDGTPGTNDMPGSINFNTTADGANSVTLRMTIGNDGSIAVANGAPKVTLGTVSAFGTTQPTNTLVLRGGTAPAGTITTAAAIFSDGTLLRKIIADGTASNVG